MIESVRSDLGQKADTARSEVGAFLWLIRMAILATVVGAVWMELRKPPEERT